MKFPLTLLLISIFQFSLAQHPIILTQREQAKVIDEILKDRLRTVLPGLMRREGFDMWVLISRENNEDPVLKTMLPATWLETRTEKEMVLYQQICRIAHAIIAEGFSDKVIQPGVTTTDDVVWWYREKIRELNLDTWFHTSVSVQRNESDAITSKRPQPLVILPGDLLHVDFGITYLRLNTDTQQHAYILKAGETGAPEYWRLSPAL